MRKCQNIAVSCIRLIVSLTKKTPDTVDDNRKKIQVLIIKLFAGMEHLYAPKNQLEIGQYGILNLNEDFCILCELHSCYPNEFLEYFMNNVSLAEAHAREGLKLYVENLPLACFVKINNTLRKDKDVIVSLDDEEKAFYQKSRELRLSLFNIRDLEERTRILREFYLSYYQKMNP